MKAIVTVIGKDQVGIIAGVCTLLAAQGVNVLDISQTIMQDYFTMIMMVDTAACRTDLPEYPPKLPYWKRPSPSASNARTSSKRCTESEVSLC